MRGGMQNNLAAALGLCIVVAGCSGGASPVAPSGAPSLTVPQLMDRRVEDIGGGGGELCGDEECPLDIAGTTVLDAGGVTLSGTYNEQKQARNDPKTFGIDVGLYGTGRFANGIGLSMSVNPSSAAVVVQFRTNVGLFEAKGSAVPGFTIQQPASQCVSNRLLETRIRLHLEHLGNTEIVDRHCIAVP